MEKAYTVEMTNWTNFQNQRPKKGSMVIICFKLYKTNIWKTDYFHEDVIQDCFDPETALYWIYPPEQNNVP